jgi:hypothetical protein
MAIGTPVQVANVGGTTTDVTTGSFTPAASSVIFAWITERNATATPADGTIADSLGLTWTKITSIAGPLSNAFLKGTLFWASSTNASMTVTATGTGANPKAVDVVTVPMGSPDFSNFNSGGQSGTVALAVALSGTPAAVIGFNSTQVGTAATQNSGLTEIVDAVPTGLTNQLRNCVAYDLTSPTATLSMTTGNNACMVALELKEATGGGITGTLSVTEDADTASSAGALAIAGTASITEGSDTASSTGVLSITGSASITEQGDTLTAAGAILIIGALATTEDDDTIVASSATPPAPGSPRCRGRMSLSFSLSL